MAKQKILKLKKKPCGVFNYKLLVSLMPGKRMDGYDLHNIATGISDEDVERIKSICSGRIKFIKKNVTRNGSSKQIVHGLYVEDQNDILLLKLAYSKKFRKFYKIEVDEKGA